MRLRPLLHDKLVVRAVFAALFATWGVLTAFTAILEFAEQLDSVGKGGYSLANVVLYVACTIPRQLYDLFPFAALIGSLLGLGGMAATSELIALRAAGISRWRICLGAIAGLAIVTAVMMVDAETLGPLGEQTAESIQISAKSSDMMISRGGGVWARDGNVFVYAAGGAKRLHKGRRDEIRLLNLRLFQFDDQGTLLHLTQAARGEYDSKQWNLFDVTHTDFGAEAVTQSTDASEPWKTGLKPEIVLAGIEAPRYQSTKELRSNIRYMHSNKVDAGDYENAYWARWVYPFNVLSLCLAALPFAFGQLRSGGFGKRLFIGIVGGISFLLVQRFTQNVATVYHLPLWGAHLSPPLLVLVASQLYFRKRA